MIQWLDAFATHGVGDRARKKGGSIFREGSCHEIFGVGGRDGLVGWAHRSRGLLVYPHAAPGIFGVLFFMTFNCRIMMFKFNERTITMQIGSGELFCFRSGPDNGRLRLSVFSGTHIGVRSEWARCSQSAPAPRNLLALAREMFERPFNPIQVFSSMSWPIFLFVSLSSQFLRGSLYATISGGGVSSAAVGLHTRAYMTSRQPYKSFATQVIAHSSLHPPNKRRRAERAKHSKSTSSLRFEDRPLTL